MSREIRRVPPDWEHPKDEKGHYKPLFDRIHLWKKGEATHYQIYEDVSEGTPVSPIFASLDEMKTWLLEQGYSEKAASKFVKYGWAPSMIFSSEKGISGIGIHSLDWL
jgi:hypothetical protein